jgi:hypothetical protein
LTSLLPSVAQAYGVFCSFSAIELVVIDIYYYLDKSSKRDLELKNCQLMCEIKAHKILKHVATRWLSLGKCLDRLFELDGKVTSFGLGFC